MTKFHASIFSSPYYCLYQFFLTFFIINFYHLCCVIWPICLKFLCICTILIFMRHGPPFVIRNSMRSRLSFQGRRENIITTNTFILYHLLVSGSRYQFFIWMELQCHNSNFFRLEKRCYRQQWRYLCWSCIPFGWNFIIQI